MLCTWIWPDLQQFTAHHCHRSEFAKLPPPNRLPSSRPWSPFLCYWTPPSSWPSPAAEGREAMALALTALRTAVLSVLRLPASQKLGFTAAQAAASSGRRSFAGGAYLDKDEVTERVLNVTKHFEKVEPGKVRAVRALGCLCGVAPIPHVCGRSINAVLLFLRVALG